MLFGHEIPTEQIKSLLCIKLETLRGRRQGVF